MAELLWWLYIPERQPLWEIKQDGDLTAFFFFFYPLSIQPIYCKFEDQKENEKEMLCFYCPVIYDCLQTEIKVMGLKKLF